MMSSDGRVVSVIAGRNGLTTMKKKEKSQKQKENNKAEV